MITDIIKKAIIKLIYKNMKAWLKFVYIISGLFGISFLSIFLPGLLMLGSGTLIVFIAHLLFGLEILKTNKFSDYSLFLNGALLFFSIILNTFFIGNEGGALALAGLMSLIAIAWIIILLIAVIIALKEKFSKTI